MHSVIYVYKYFNIRHVSPGVFSSSPSHKPSKYYDQQWDQFVKGGAVKVSRYFFNVILQKHFQKAANVKGRTNTGSRFMRASRPAQQQSTVHQSSHHLS